MNTGREKRMDSKNTKAATYAVEVGRGAPPYTTDDTGRLNAYLLGVLVGAGPSMLDASVQANRLCEALALGADVQTLELHDGRNLRLSLWPGRSR